MMKILVRHTSIVITEYELGDCEKLEKYLSIWDSSTFKYDKIGYYYNEDAKTLTIPRGVSIPYLEKNLNCLAEILYEPDGYDNVSIKLKAQPKDDIQRNAIAFLLGENEYSYTKKYSQLILDLDTGLGKTYVSLATMTFTKLKSIVITPSNKIKEQWVSTFTNMSDLTEYDICDITSSKDILKILEIPQHKLKYKVYIVNHSTIDSCSTKYGWETITNLFKYAKIGLKFYDEAHLFLKNLLNMDFNTNTKKTVYLTATFGRSDPKENMFMDKCFKNSVRFTDTKAESLKSIKKHVVYMCLSFRSSPTLDDKAYMFTYKGFNKVRYFDYEMGQPAFIDAVLFALDLCLKKLTGQILIFGSTINGVNSLRDIISEKYADKTVSVYHSKINKDDKIKALEADIICSLPQSAGTGFDQRGLQGVIVGESYSSKIEAKQLLGRLREYDGANTIFIELVDNAIPKSKSLQKSRLTIFKKHCLSIINHEIKK